MLNEALTPRQQRGLMLAATANIRQRRWQFDVPSATNSGVTYLVVHVAGQFLCNCPDYELTQQPCKHIYAVQYRLKLERADEAPATVEPEAVRVTYPQAWSAYN